MTYEEDITGMGIKHLLSLKTSHLVFAGAWWNSEGNNTRWSNNETYAQVKFYPATNIGFSIAITDYKYKDRRNNAAEDWYQYNLGIEYFISSDLSLALTSFKTTWSNNSENLLHRIRLTSRF